MIERVVDAIRNGTGFGFHYDGVPSTELLQKWKRRRTRGTSEGSGSLETIVWSDTRTGLRVVCTLFRFTDYPAVEWLIRFRNEGQTPTSVIADVRDLDIPFSRPLDDGSFTLHKLKGAPSNPTDYEPATVSLHEADEIILGGGGGRSSNRDFPFFRLDTGEGTLIMAVGWSGQWQATMRCNSAQPSLQLTAGLEKTHFLLLPGEDVRGCRILLLDYPGDPERAHGVFRRLIWKHYASRAHGREAISRQTIPCGRGKGIREPQPVLFCNTCFTRGGAWLNECNERNQVSLIHALVPLGVQAIITDAGWFKGGWPAGAGNWDHDPEKYPHGMGPVAAVAKQYEMAYGLWFEPERVVPQTDIDRDKGPWVLRDTQIDANWGSLLDFGLPEVRSFFLGIVERYLSLPGFDVYRQDFNMDPLSFWRENDAPDRQGIREMKYIEGLYLFWDMIRTAHPDVFMEECASGGRRTDLETIMRFQVHQKSDYWFDNMVDQASLFALSAYLPSATISVPLNRLDDYSFHSTLASSLILGWIADDPDFDLGRARHLTNVYRSVRHLLNGDWYGLTPWSRDPQHWLVSQYHREDLGEGTILAFRRERCDPSLTVFPRGLDAAADYEIHSTVTGNRWRMKGSGLMNGFTLAIPEAPASDLIVYRKT